VTEHSTTREHLHISDTTPMTSRFSVLLAAIATWSVLTTAWSQHSIARDAATSTSISPPFQEASQQHRPLQRTDPTSVTVHEQLLAKTKQGTIDVYFEGDSITRRWGATDYPKYLAHWKKNFHGWNAANFAWGGDNTHNILWRLRNGELDGVQPKVVVLQAGTNNLPWSGPANEATIADIVTGIQAILCEFQNRVPDATIILTGLFARPQNPAAAPAIAEVNRQLAALADGQRIRFIDINGGLVDENGKARPGVYSDGGLHLDVPGYEVWANALRPILQDLLGPPAAEDHAPPPTGDPSANR
jgi:lysophospholipase L1-like esterase